MLGGYPKERENETREERSSDDSDENIGHCFCMVVTKVGENQRTELMKRVEWMHLDISEGAKVRENKENWKTVTIV